MEVVGPIAFEFKLAVGPGFNGIAQALHFHRQLVLVNHPQQLLLLKENVVVERLPAAIGQLRGVDHHAMGVQLGILFAGGVVVELGHNQVARPHRLSAFRRPYPRLGIAFFQDGQGARHGGVMGLLDGGIFADQGR